MPESVIMERINIPIPVLFGSAATRAAIHEICQNRHADDSFMNYASVTFRQLFLLSEGGRLSKETEEEITEYLAAEDFKHPVYLDEVYPYLKDPAWTVSMSRISYIKVSAENGESRLFTIASIEKPGGRDNGAPCLKLIPEEDGSRAEKAGPVTVEFADERRLYLFMKKIILNGSVDLMQDCDGFTGIRITP